MIPEKIKRRMTTCGCRFSRAQLSATSWTAAHQAPLPVEFSRQQSWSGLPSPPPGGLPAPGTEPGSPASPTLGGGFLPLCHLGSLEGPCDSAVPLLGVYLRVKSEPRTDTCASMFIHHDSQ